MNYKRIGNTDLNVSEICLGSMTWGQQNSESEAHQQLDYAKANGINFIDTAEMYSAPTSEATYGATESIIGRWLNEKKCRDKLIIASKVAGPGNWIPHIRNGMTTFDYNTMKSAIEGSLSRLKTDYIDLYQIHWPERNTNRFGTLDYKHDDGEPDPDILKTLEGINELLKEGKIRYFGLSNETAWGTMKFLSLAREYNLPKPASIQNAYSLLNRSFEVGLAEVAERENIPLLAYSPLAFGTLSGKYLDWKNRILMGQTWRSVHRTTRLNQSSLLVDLMLKLSTKSEKSSQPVVTDRTKRSSTSRMQRTIETFGLLGDLSKSARLNLFDQYTRYSSPEAIKATSNYVRIARQNGIDAAQMALAFVRQKSFVASTIIGTTNVEQLKKNIESHSLTLPQELIQQIDLVHRRISNPAP